MNELPVEVDVKRELLSSLVSLVRQWGTYTQDWGIAHQAGVDMPDNLIRVIFLLGARNGNFRLSDMTAHLGISRATLSKSLSLLRSRGLIAGEAAPGDRRSVHASLTPSGKEAYERLLHAGLSRVTSAAHGHSEEELKIINRFLTELISLLDDEPPLMLPLQAN